MPSNETLGMSTRLDATIKTRRYWRAVNGLATVTALFVLLGVVASLVPAFGIAEGFERIHPLIGVAWAGAIVCFWGFMLTDFFRHGVAEELPKRGDHRCAH